jgi:hypothetical protein
MAVADEKCADKTGTAGCSKTCKMVKGLEPCVAMHDSAKAAEVKAKADETKAVPGPEHAAKAVETTTKIEKAATPEKADIIKETGEAHEPENTCGGITKCIELDQFHAAMHPMALAMGFEGDEKPNMTKFRALYPKMKERTDALAKMPVDDKGMKDPKRFTEKRAELVKLVDELGAACKGTDDSKIGPAFEKVHEGYIQLTMLAK